MCRSKQKPLKHTQRQEEHQPTHTHTHTVSTLKNNMKNSKNKKECGQKPQWRCTEPTYVHTGNTHTHSHTVSAAAGGTHTHISRLSGISFSRRSDDMDAQQQWEGSVSTGRGDHDGAAREEHQKHFLLNCFATIHKQRRSVFLPLEGCWLRVRSSDVFSSVLHFVAYFTKFKNFKFKCSISNWFFWNSRFLSFVEVAPAALGGDCASNKCSGEKLQQMFLFISRLFFIGL